MPTNDRPPYVMFAADDHLLMSDIRKGILPHMPETGKAVCFGAVVHADMMDLIVVGISALPTDSAVSVLRTRGRFPACGIIVRTEDRRKWGTLSLLHAKLPFKFLVAASGPRTELRKLFPDIPILSDITDLVIPGKKIAAFIWEAAQECAAPPKFHKRHRIG